MGKSHRNVSAMSSSESMHADKSRDFAKNKKHILIIKSEMIIKIVMKILFKRPILKRICI